MFGRQARLPVDTILGITHVGNIADTEMFAQNTRGNLQIAFELARRNLTERATKQAANNKKLAPYPVFKPEQKVLVYRPFHDTDGPNPTVTVARTLHSLLSTFSRSVSSTTHQRDTRSKYQYTLPTSNRTISGRNPQHLNLISWLISSWENKSHYLHWTIKTKFYPELSHIYRWQGSRPQTWSWQKKYPQLQVPITSARLWPWIRYWISRADEVPQYHELIAAYRTPNGLWLIALLTMILSSNFWLRNSDQTRKRATTQLSALQNQ